MEGRGNEGIAPCSRARELFQSKSPSAKATLSLIQEAFQLGAELAANRPWPRKPLAPSMMPCSEMLEQSRMTMPKLK